MAGVRYLGSRAGLLSAPRLSAFVARQHVIVVTYELMYGLELTVSGALPLKGPVQRDYYMVLDNLRP